VSAGPLRGRIRLSDELRDRFARRTPGGFIQRIEILPAGSARPGNALPVNLTSNSALFVGVSRNQAGIEHKGGSGDQPFRNAALHHCLKVCAAGRNRGTAYSWRKSSGPGTSPSRPSRQIQRKAKFRCTSSHNGRSKRMP
jgi:hypothetical protein